MLFSWSNLSKRTDEDLSEPAVLCSFACFSLHTKGCYMEIPAILYSSILLGIWKSATLDPFAGFTNIRKKRKNRIFPEDEPWPLGFSRWKHAETGAFWSQLSDENPMNNVGLSRLKEETIHPQLWLSKFETCKNSVVFWCVPLSHYPPFETKPKR